MIISLRPKSLSVRFPTPNLKWVSTITSKRAQLPQDHPEGHAGLFFDAKTNHNNSDYELSLVSALKSCSSLLAISQGQQIHCLVLKSGLGSNNFIRNSLINMYAKCGFVYDARSLFDSLSKLDPVSCNIMIAGYVKIGQLDNARRLFEIMPRKGCISYTTMIMGLAQNGCWREAVEVFKDMRVAGVVPTDVTMASVISACAHLGGIWNCRMLHVLVIKLQLAGLVLISTNLLHMYCLCLSVAEAINLFEEMPERNTVSWNVMLNGYAKAGLVDRARELFERIPAKDVVSWGTMIDGYVQVELLGEALMIYRAMLRTGVRPNDVMIVDLISACGRLMALGEGQQFHGITVKTSFDSHDFMQATIIHFYAACGRMTLARLQFEVGIKDHLASWNALIAGFIRNEMIDEARQIFNEMPERDVYSCSAMISGYAQSEQPTMALELFHRMVACGIQPNEITMVSVFSAIATLGSLKEGRWAHEYIYNNSIPLNDNLSAAVIDMYAKCGSIDSAFRVFYQIQEKTSNVSPWNAIICGLAMHGHANLSLEVFSDLQIRRIKLNSITFIGVLTACCHAGLVELGKRYFKIMKNVYNLEPNIKHYGCMVDLLGRAGRLEEAEELVRGMPMKADIVIWGTLLAACRTHGNVEIGERAAKSLAMLEPSHGAGRVLLSNIYADAGRWEDAFSIRRAMQIQRMKKSPGCSGVV
ncbi:pentatricopeptide repeat-containing protein At5g19020, mitochondrial [Corylus avellana]|uniref:pentatricopeptide repeat-containing protein At5g19020, mitochondrial n=1 Tax=Corylus avellana TaxID=13451 RepID=UPI001E213DCD|nr:pentatricopeptide repeat-containing protein At5g19020, mitochondrial [Corylus avellana]